MLRRTGTFIGILLLLGAMRAFACACCAQGHELWEKRAPLSRYDLQQLQSLTFTGAFGIDIYGEAQPEIDIKATQVQGHWRRDVLVLHLMRDEKSLGVVQFKPTGPARWLQRDRRYLTDTAHTQHMPVQLYKEVTINGEFIRTDGLAAQLGFTLSKYGVLYLHGVGNACFAAGDIRHWNLSFDMRRGDKRQIGRAYGAADCCGVSDIIR